MKTQLIACITVLLGLAPLHRSDFVHEPFDSYQKREYHGFSVYVSTAALENIETTRPALTLLKRKLGEITELVPPKAVETLRTVPFFIEHMNPDFPCACYHPGAAWLSRNGYIPEKLRSVEITNPVHFVDWVNRTQPMMVLHELAHAYHDIMFGYDDAYIKAVFKLAVASKTYEAVPYVTGGDKRHYALNNQIEYFAEATEAYFGRNDYYPFTRKDLKQHDPKGYEMVKRMWGIE